MIWLIGKSGLLGQEVELMLKEKNFSYVASGHETDITDFDNLKDFSKDKQINWIINCVAYTAVDKAEEDSENAFKLNHHAVCNIIKIATQCITNLCYGFNTDIFVIVHTCDRILAYIT